MGTTKKRIYSLGTSTRSESEFVALLGAYGVETLVDVRRFPTSKLEHFKRENLEAFLRRDGIDYVYLEDKLGGYRKEGYEAYMLTEGFSKGLKELEGTGLEKTIAFVCAERLPWRCHRRFIGNALSVRGWEVIHIIDKDRIWQPD